MVATVAPLVENDGSGHDVHHAAVLPDLFVERIQPSPLLEAEEGAVDIVATYDDNTPPVLAPTVTPLVDDYGSGHGASVLPELIVERFQPPPLPEEEDDVVDIVATYADDTPQVIGMRPMAVEDIDQVRELHEQWFPIRYQQNFYDGAAQGVWRETGFPLFTRLASERHEPARLSPLDEEYSKEFGYTQWTPRQPMIYGAVMASTIPLTSVEDPGLLAADDYVHTHVMYILTLGSRAAVRRRGVASGLLAECITEARRQPHCGAVYLHVKADNVSALRFYEKNGFQNLRYLEDYYVIDGVRHSAYLYILYVNGAEPQSGWLELLTKPIIALFSMASQGLKRLMVGILEENQNRMSSTDKDVYNRRKLAPPRNAPPLVDDAYVNHQPQPLPSSPAVVSCV